MKIGILTFHDADNYGAVLQAYALKETIKGIEKDVEIINYKQPHVIKQHRIISLNTRNVRSFLKSIMFNILDLYNTIIKKCKFSRFRREYMDITKEAFWNSSQIRGKDTYIVGSDVVWSCQNIHFDNAFFLGFCSDEQRRVSYAASFGKDFLLLEEEAFIKMNIHNIDYISVREDTAVNLLSNITDKEISQVLDPTLLADHQIWSKIDIRHRITGKYLLVYRVTGIKEVFDVAESIAKRLHLKVLYINNSIRKNPYDFIKAKKVGPKDFLSLFMNASFIVTNSFHGTAFSVVFNKNFITVPTKKSKTRMISLLNLLQLSDRIITDGNEIGEEYSFDIDYSIPNQILKKEKERSLSFLVKAIQD